MIHSVDRKLQVGNAILKLDLGRHVVGITGIFYLLFLANSVLRHGLIRSDYAYLISGSQFWLYDSLIQNIRQCIDGRTPGRRIMYSVSPISAIFDAYIFASNPWTTDCVLIKVFESYLFYNFHGDLKNSMIELTGLKGSKFANSPKGWKLRNKEANRWYLLKCTKILNFIKTKRGLHYFSFAFYYSSTSTLYFQGYTWSYFFLSPLPFVLWYSIRTSVVNVCCTLVG